MKTIPRTQIPIFTLFLLFSLYASTIQAQPPKIFILHSYEENHVCGQPQADGVIAALKEAGFEIGTNLIVESYYMDTKRKNNTPKLIQEQAMIALDKIKKFKPGILITIDDNAFKNVALRLVNSDIAIVFSGMNGQPEVYSESTRFMDSRENPGYNVTGVYELLHIKDAIRVHSKIFPGLKETRIIIDKDSPTGKAIKKQVELELDQLPKDQWSIKIVGNLEEYKTALEDANRDANVGAIYPVALVLKDEHGKTFTAPDIFKLTTEKSIKPEMALNYTFCKLGLFGGATVDFHAMGKQAGVKVVSILRGTAPANIPIEEAKDFALAFNWDRAQQLKIFIPEEILAAADDIFTTN